MALAQRAGKARWHSSGLQRWLPSITSDSDSAGIEHSQEMFSQHVRHGKGNASKSWVHSRSFQERQRIRNLSSVRRPSISQVAGTVERTSSNKRQLDSCQRQRMLFSTSFHQNTSLSHSDGMRRQRLPSQSASATARHFFGEYPENDDGTGNRSDRNVRPRIESPINKDWHMLVDFCGPTNQPSSFG